MKMANLKVPPFKHSIYLLYAFTFRPAVSFAISENVTNMSQQFPFLTQTPIPQTVKPLIPSKSVPPLKSMPIELSCPYTFRSWLRMVTMRFVLWRHNTGLRLTCFQGRGWLAGVTMYAVFTHAVFSTPASKVRRISGKFYSTRLTRPSFSPNGPRT